MRLGVLDVGSNTVHLVAVDAKVGGRPTPMSDWKTPLRLVEQTDKKGAIHQEGMKKLISAVQEASDLGKKLGCDEFLPIATSAVRSATNSEYVLDQVKKETGVSLEILSGKDEARLTFLAVRRWYGWSAGRITNLDIGGGSLEMSTGTDEEPDMAFSLDLGAGRLTHNWFQTDPPSKKDVGSPRCRGLNNSHPDVGCCGHGAYMADEQDRDQLYDAVSRMPARYWQRRAEILQDFDFPEDSDELEPWLIWDELDGEDGDPEPARRCQ